MSEQTEHLSIGEGGAQVRACTLLHCAAEKVRGRRRRVLVLTLGDADGAVDRVVMDDREAQRWLERLAFHMRETGPRGVRYGSLQWTNRRSVLRADAVVDRDAERVADRAKRDLPDVWEYVADQLRSLRRSLAQRGKTAARPEKVVGRVRQAMLVVLEAMRTDT